MTYTPDAVTDISHLATKVQLDQKANASTVGGLSTALNAKAAQADLEALAERVDQVAAVAQDAVSMAQELKAEIPPAPDLPK